MFWPGQFSIRLPVGSAQPAARRRPRSRVCLVRRGAPSPARAAATFRCRWVVARARAGRAVEQDRGAKRASNLEPRRDRRLPGPGGRAAPRAAGRGSPAVLVGSPRRCVHRPALARIEGRRFFCFGVSHRRFREWSRVQTQWRVVTPAKRPSTRPPDKMFRTSRPARRARKHRALDRLRGGGP